MTKDVDGYIQSRLDAGGDEGLLGLWRQLRQLYATKLWHQATSILDQLVARPELKKNDGLMHLYENVIKDVEMKIQPLRLVVMLLPVVDSIKDLDEAQKFLSDIGDKLKPKSLEAFAYVRTTQASLYLDRSQKEEHVKEVKALIEEVDGLLNNDVEAVGIVHKEFYRLSSTYNKLRGEHAAFYQSSLKFLGVSDLKDHTKEHNCELAFAIALSALLGEGVFNFGELLCHDVIKHLDGRADWLKSLLNTFYAGDVKTFRQLAPEWGKQADLKANEAALYEKICLLAVLNMTFECSATERQLKFADIAERTGLTNDKIEILVMKALSQGLIKGEIDQVDQTVNVSWVRPRVLDKAQIKVLMGKIESWSTSITAMEKLIEANASDILTN